jgi:hypothetical protein
MNWKIISIILINVAYVFLLPGCVDCKTDYMKNVKPSVIDGIIVERDSLGNHGVPIIKIKDKNGSLTSFGIDYSLTPLWEASQLGDSISKKKNSLAFQIIKKDTTLTFYPICNCCDTLK